MIKSIRITKTTAIIAVFLLLAGMLFLLEKEWKFQKAFEQIIKKDGWIEIDDTVFISTNRGINVTLVTSEDEAALIDTGYQTQEAERMKAFIKQKGLKLNCVILTHMHPDHIANLSLFEEMGAVVYRPSNMRDGQVIKLGDLHLKCKNTRGHAGKAHFSIEVVEKRMLIAGDVLTNDWVPYYDTSAQELLNTIDSIGNRHYSIIIPGHGDVLEAEKTTQMPKEYLNNAIKAARSYIYKGKGVNELVAEMSVTDCYKGYEYLYRIEYLDKATLERIHADLLKKIYDEVKKSKL